jgi:serine/threonine protein kinase/Tfp pilus assembly protein PilF
MSFVAGAKLGRYEIRSKIGEGGMGEVYLAEDTKLHRRVALKILPAEFSQDSQRTARFLREAQAASGLNHPNICTIHEINDENDVPFIAMEYVEGETLFEKIKDEGLDLAETLDIALQIADALAEAHAHDIVHRDIKPANIIVNRRGQVKVLDFGLAKRVVVAKGEAETQPLLSQAGMILGTAAYMSPEQARGLAVDARTDVWSFGVVLYEMLTGEKPFSGATTTDLLAAILRSEPEDLWKFNHEVPAELERIVLKALRKKRDERYGSAKDLYADLKQLRKDLDLAAAREMSEPRPVGVAGGPASKENPPGTSGGTDLGARSFSSESWAPSFVAEKVNSIAVLPFTNMSADAENEYFCDGLAEELLNALAKIENLKVAARTSAFSFKGKSASISEIGNTLGVKTVLEGSVRKSGNRLRITVQLINAADGYHLWSERYDREMKDIFDVQDEITLAVVDALKVKLLGEEKAVVLKRYIENTEAYELYLKGRYYYNKHTTEDWLKGIEYFEKAVEIEPEYAPAYAQIGICYVTLSHFGVLSPHETFPKGKAAVTRALEIDDQLAEGHSALANILFYYEWDWAAAEREFRRAARLNPNDANTRWRLGMLLVSRERFAEAIKEARRAVELDPLSLLANLYAGWIYLLADRPDRALKQVAQMIEIEPRFHGAYWLKGGVYLGQEKYEEAVDALEKSMALGGTPIVKSSLGCAYGLGGNRDEALRVLNELLETREKQYTTALNIARVYNGIGEIDSACEWLERSVEERNGEVVFLNVGTKSGTGNIWRKTLRTDPRYQDILRRIGLPTDELAQGRSTEEASEAPTAISHPTTDAKMPE